MERIEFVNMLGPLLVTYRQSFDRGQWAAYHKALEDVPASLLAAAVERAMKAGGQYLPRPGELRRFAEDARKELIARYPFEHGECCSEQGWSKLIVNGVERMVRCQCWSIHQQRLEMLGVGTQPLALPEAHYEAEG